MVCSGEKVGGLGQKEPPCATYSPHFPSSEEGRQGQEWKKQGLRQAGGSSLRFNPDWPCSGLTPLPAVSYTNKCYPSIQVSVGRDGYRDSTVTKTHSPGSPTLLPRTRDVGLRNSTPEAPALCSLVMLGYFVFS